MQIHYTLNGHTPVPCEDISEWTKWRATANIEIEETDIGDARIRTHFLGIDHSLAADARPLLFETLVFRKSVFWKTAEGEIRDWGLWTEMGREHYSTWDEAKCGHWMKVEQVYLRLLQ